MQTPAFLAPWTPRVLGILRIVIGFLFLQHGSAKLLGMPHVAMFDGLQLFSLIGVAGILELVGGILILIGLWARPTAFIRDLLFCLPVFRLCRCRCIQHRPCAQGRRQLIQLQSGDEFERAQAHGLVVDVAGNHELVGERRCQELAQSLSHRLRRADEGVMQHALGAGLLAGRPTGFYVVHRWRQLTRCAA